MTDTDTFELGKPAETRGRPKGSTNKRVRRNYVADAHRYEGLIASAVRALETPTQTPEAREAMVLFAIRTLKGE